MMLDTHSFNQHLLSPCYIYHQHSSGDEWRKERKAKKDGRPPPPNKGMPTCGQRFLQFLNEYPDQDPT